MMAQYRHPRQEDDASEQTMSAMLLITRILFIAGIFYGYQFMQRESRVSRLKRAIADAQNAQLEAQTSALTMQAMQQNALAGNMNANGMMNEEGMGINGLNAMNNGMGVGMGNGMNGMGNGMNGNMNNNNMMMGQRGGMGMGGGMNGGMNGNFNNGMRPGGFGGF